MSVVFEKFKEVSWSVLPVTLIVCLIQWIAHPLPGPIFLRFLIGAVLIVMGLTVFLLGVDVAISPIGNALGAAIVKPNKIALVVGAGLLLGFFISVAEPDLHILADQVQSVTDGDLSKWGIVLVVSVGIALLFASGLVRIIFNVPLYRLLLVLYLMIFVLALFTPREFLAISFDASGATTGALTVPFMLALALGVSRLKKDSKSSEKDSFGLVAVASAGAIMAVMVMNLISGSEKLSGSLPPTQLSESVLGPFAHELPKVAGEIALALSPILVIYIIANLVSLRMSRRSTRRIIYGLLFSFAGLVVFLTGVHAGFMDVGAVVGQWAASLESKAYVVGLGFLLGFVTILAEPAVHVLTRQIEEVTSGYVRRRIVLATLSLGVGAAVALSMVRILVYELQLWHFLLPGYALCMLLMFVVPKLFVGIAFDSGGVASGPMTATFILAYSQGAAAGIPQADVLVDGFGMIAMVAMTPIIALQMLGLIYKIKSKKGGRGHAPG